MTRISRMLPSCDKTGLPQLQWFGLLCQVSWQRYFGTPHVRITDGGPEFRGDFAQSGEYAGIDADAPWQNGKCERHSGLVKDLLAKGFETEVVSTPDGSGRLSGRDCVVEESTRESRWIHCKGNVSCTSYSRTFGYGILT